MEATARSGCRIGALECGALAEHVYCVKEQQESTIVMVDGNRNDLMKRSEEEHRYEYWE